MPIIEGYECKGYVEQPDGTLRCIEDDMTAEEREAFWQKVRNRFANGLLEIMYEKETRKDSDR